MERLSNDEGRVSVQYAVPVLALVGVVTVLTGNVDVATDMGSLIGQGGRSLFQFMEAFGAGLFNDSNVVVNETVPTATTTIDSFTHSGQETTTSTVSDIHTHNKATGLGRSATEGRHLHCIKTAEGELVDVITGQYPQSPYCITD